MNVSSEIMKSRRKFATDLRRLRDIIYEYFPTAEIGSFESAITELKDFEKIPSIPGAETDTNRWGYTLSRLIFKFDKTPKHTTPNNCKDLKLILDINVVGNCQDLNTLNDPLKWLEFNIVIEGTKFRGDENLLMITSFHLDRHQYSIEDNDAEYPHPLYHFHFGGKKLNEYTGSIETGNLLLFDSPRIAHYPMEAILGIDFILSNFFPQVWLRMKNESNEYLNLIEEYQEMILKPYIHTHASQWPYSTIALASNSLWNPNAICPQLFKS
jgi:hypothetical protein